MITSKSYRKKVKSVPDEMLKRARALSTSKNINDLMTAKQIVWLIYKDHNRFYQEHKHAIRHLEKIVLDKQSAAWKEYWLKKES